MEIIIEPGTAYSWKEFLEKKPNNSIALDGFVADSSNYEPLSKKANFNHHQNCDRLATRSTCSQVLLAIRMGLFESYRDNGKIVANVFVNDCDEDVCTSIFLLRNSYVSSIVHNPRLNLLVSIEDFFDTTGGIFPFNPDLPVLEEIAWVYEPYQLARKNNQDLTDISVCNYIINTVCDRIHSFLMGTQKKISFDTRFELIHKIDSINMAFIKEIGNYGRFGAINQGYTTLLIQKSSFIINSSTSEIANEVNFRYNYTILKLSQFIPFDINLFCSIINNYDSSRGWAGSNIIAGSPRPDGSILKISDIFTLVEKQYLNK